MLNWQYWILYPFLSPLYLLSYFEEKQYRSKDGNSYMWDKSKWWHNLLIKHDCLYKWDNHLR